MGVGCPSNPKVRVAELAATQFGRVRRDQVRALGVSDRTIGRWRADGYLHRLLPRVYAVGHAGRAPEADLAAAVLYAGPNAMLSHGTAVWWLDLLRYPPDEIHVSTPREIKSIDGVVVHPCRNVERVRHRGLPVTTVSQALLDFAAAGHGDLLRLALANADYQDCLDVTGIRKLTGRGIAGSAAIGQAIQIHLPELAHTRSELERRLLTFCQDHRLPIPQCNVYLHGWLADAYWPDHRLVVEVDGYRGHRTRAQLERDHQRDFELRAAGFIVLRYTWRQLTTTPASIARELRQYVH
jgi:very-short-patch-repair endonuclease/predicted transcriptional regulator of viral defense system